MHSTQRMMNTKPLFRIYEINTRKKYNSYWQKQNLRYQIFVLNMLILKRFSKIYDE